MGSHYQAEQLVFVDETGSNRKTTSCTHGWAPTGDQACRRDFFVQGMKYLVLPALSIDGIVHADIQAATYTANTFNTFIEALLLCMNPFPGPCSVLIMDNASIHKSERLEEICAKRYIIPFHSSIDILMLYTCRGVHLIFLPPYSPDFNPIEEVFSFIKGWLQCNQDHANIELGAAGIERPKDLLFEAVYSVTPEATRSWFSHAGCLL